MPQSEPSVRRDSVITGKAELAIGLPFDFYNAIKNNPATEPLIVADNQSLTVVFNNKQGSATDVKLRLAIQAALTMEPIMRAASSNPQIYAIDPSWAPDRKGVWHSTAGAEGWGKAEAIKAQHLLAMVITSNTTQLAFNLKKGSIPIRTDVDASAMDICAQAGLAVMKDPSRQLPSPGMLINPDAAGAVQDVISKFWNNANPNLDEVVKGSQVAIRR